MSYIEAKKAIEKRLAAMPGVIATAREGMNFDPVPGVPYQRINILKSASEDLAMGRKITRLNGIAQVTLFYPSPASTGTTLPDAMAESIRLWFKPVQALVESATTTFIVDSASIATGFPDGDRWVIPVSIPFYVNIYG